MHRAQARGGTSGASGEPGRATGRAPASPGIPPKRAKVTAEQGAAEEGPTRLAAPAFVRKLKNAAIGTGCDIRLRVVAVGNPRPNLRWYHNEEQLAPRGEEYGTLWIRDSTKEDAGVYTCVAENERGEAMTSAVLAIIDMEGKGHVAIGAAAPPPRFQHPHRHCFPVLKAEAMLRRLSPRGVPRGWLSLSCAVSDCHGLGSPVLAAPGQLCSSAACGCSSLCQAGQDARARRSWNM